MKRIVFVVFVGLLLSCADHRNSGGGSAVAAGTLTDLHYGEDPLQTLDVYQPAGAESSPVLVMVHGGWWQFGDKASPNVVESKLQRWLPRGFVLVSLNYRLVPDVDPLQQVDDIAAALVFVQHHARSWGGDPDRVILLGHSAGAHLVSLLAVAPRRVMEGGGRAWLGTVSIDTAAFDMVGVMTRRHAPFYDDAFGDDPAFWREASPLYQLNGPVAPILAICSTERRDHPCDGAREFADRAATVNSRVEVLPRAMSHNALNKELGETSPYTLAVERFMASLDPLVAARLVTP